VRERAPKKKELEEREKEPSILLVISVSLSEQKEGKARGKEKRGGDVDEKGRYRDCKGEKKRDFLPSVFVQRKLHLKQEKRRLLQSPSLG